MKKVTQSAAFKWATFAGAILVVGGAGYAIWKEGATKKSILPALMLLAGASALTMSGAQLFGAPVVTAQTTTPKKEEEGA